MANQIFSDNFAALKLLRRLFFSIFQLRKIHSFEWPAQICHHHSHNWIAAKRSSLSNNSIVFFLREKGNCVSRATSFNVFSKIEHKTQHPISWILISKKNYEFKWFENCTFTIKMAHWATFNWIYLHWLDNFANPKQLQNVELNCSQNVYSEQIQAKPTAAQLWCWLASAACSRNSRRRTTYMQTSDSCS